MPDRFAALALAFIDRYPSDTDPSERTLYAFLAVNYPKIELTSNTVSGLQWSIRMLAGR